MPIRREVKRGGRFGAGWATIHLRVRLLLQPPESSFARWTAGEDCPTWFSSRVNLMLVVMKAQATEEQVHAVCQKIEKLGYRAHPMPCATRTAIGITGNKAEVEQGTLEE